MPKQIYNEGRVVGLSAYETYVKQALSSKPNIPVATEREWLASTVASGTSMLLKVSATNKSYVDYALPSDSRLVAANTIVASFLYGVKATFSGNWATQITSYGKIADAPNAGTVSSFTSTLPYSDEETKEIQKQQMQYIKIVDGVVLQKGAWKSSEVTPPKTIPNKEGLKEGNATVRLAFSDEISTEFYVLLTGFTDLQVVQGVSGLDDSVKTDAPQNGDFLGPATFPWMSKIWFATPANLTYQLKQGLNGNNRPNVFITNSKDGVSTEIEVMNNITSQKSKEYLFITPVDKDGNKLEGEMAKYAAGYGVELDGAKLIDDSVSPGYGVNIVNSSNETNSQGSAKKVFKTNISHGPNGSGITVSQPASGDANKSGTVTQTIVTNIDAGKGVQITDATNSTKRTIHSNLTPGDGIIIDPKTSTTAGAQTISQNVAVGKGLKKTVGTDKTDTKGNTITLNTNLSSGGDGLSFDNDNGKITNTWAMSKEYARNNPSTNSYSSPRGQLSGTQRPSILKITTGTKSVHALLLSEDIVADSNLDANRRTITVNPDAEIDLTSANSHDNITWSALLDALHNDRGIDVLGDRLKSAKQSLIANSNYGYLEFGSKTNPLRLYISSEAPPTANVPVGSIGIGWGFSG